jgi:hypothetical protein
MVQDGTSVYAARMTAGPRQTDDDKRRAALGELDRLHRGENVFTGALGAMAQRTGRHFAGKDDTRDDAVEIWGKRIGRALSLAGVIALASYLWLTYIR